jgi:hypothetical protein
MLLPGICRVTGWAAAARCDPNRDSHRKTDGDHPALLHLYKVNCHIICLPYRQFYFYRDHYLDTLANVYAIPPANAYFHIYRYLYCNAVVHGHPGAIRNTAPTYANTCTTNANTPTANVDTGPTYRDLASRDGHSVHDCRYSSHSLNLLRISTQDD